MPKYTPLRERVLVAQATQNTAEIRRIKREIIDARNATGSVVAAAKRLGVNQLTLRRIAAELEIEPDLGIDRARGEPDLFAARARIAVRKGDVKAVEALRKRVLDAMDAAGERGLAGVADSLGVSEWVLRKTIDVLGMSDEVQRAHPGRFSLLGERARVALASKDAAELRRMKAEIAAAIRSADGDIEAASDTLGVTSRTLRSIAESIGAKIAVVERAGPVVLLARIRAATEAGNEKALEAIKKEVLAAIKRSRGSLKDAAKALGVGAWTLRSALNALGIAEEVREKFPGRGKAKMLTVRVNGRDVTHSIAEWARLRGIKRTTILMRLRDGKSHEEAVSQGDLRER